MKKFLLVSVFIFAFAGAVFAANVEDSLTPPSEQSAYIVVNFDDTQALLKWIFSQEHIDTFMPLILASESSNEIIGVIEMISAFAQNTPLKSAAILAGVDDKQTPFFKMAFTVKPEAEVFFKKISDGSAEALDIAKLLMGKDNPMAAFAESMIKVEKAEDNILKVDNEIFLKTQGDIIVAGLSVDDVKNSLAALEDEDLRLFSKKVRRFAPRDFAWIHADIKTLKSLDADDALDVEEISKYLKKPMDIEIGFMRVPEKFLLSLAYNFKEAFSKEFFDKSGLKQDYETVKGGNLNLRGAKSPLLALGGTLNIKGLLMTEEGRDLWKQAVKQAKNRFGISEEDLTKLFEGAFSLVFNDNVTVEGFKVPAVYLSQTGVDGAADKIFETLEKSQHFHKAQDGVLQVDSSLSPVACFVNKNGETLGINFAELENITAETTLKPALKELLDTPSLSSLWVDFAEIQSWINSPENGVLTILEPFARLTGQGAIFDACKEVLNAKLSVPSFAFYADSIEVFHTEFQIDEDVKAEEGLMRKLVKISKNFLSFDKVEDKPEENK